MKQKEKEIAKELSATAPTVDAVDAAGADIDDIIEILEDLGKQSASRK